MKKTSKAPGTKKKLGLKTATVRKLDQNEAARVGGGMRPPQTQDSSPSGSHAQC